MQSLYTLSHFDLTFISQGYSRFLITSFLPLFLIWKRKKKRTHRIGGGKKNRCLDFAKLLGGLKESSNALIVHCHSVSPTQDAQARNAHQLSIGSIRRDNDFLLDATGGPLKSYIYIYIDAITFATILCSSRSHVDIQSRRPWYRVDWIATLA